MVLRGYWPLDESSGSVATDYSPLGNDGSHKSNVTPGSPGLFGENSAYYEETSNDTGITTFSDIALQSSTHAVWFNHDNLSSLREVLRKRTASDNYNVSIRMNSSDNTISFRFYDGDNWNEVNTSAPSSNTWNFAVIWVDKNKDELRGYLNGELVGSADIPYYQDSSTPGDTGWSVGGYPTVGSFKGRIAHYRVYDHLLSMTEVQYLYNMGKQGIHISERKRL